MDQKAVLFLVVICNPRSNLLPYNLLVLSVNAAASSYYGVGPEYLIAFYPLKAITFKRKLYSRDIRSFKGLDIPSAQFAFKMITFKWQNI